MITKMQDAAGHKRLSYRFIVAAVVSLFVCSITVTAHATASTYSSVTVSDDYRTVTVTTVSNDAYEIADQAGMTIGANDSVDLSGFRAGEGGTIVIDRAKVIRVDDQNMIAYYVAYNTVGEVFLTQGISFGKNDLVPVSLDEDVTDGMQITIKRASTVYVEYLGESIPVNIAEGTVADALKKADVEVDGDDVVNPGLAQDITNVSRITVYKVEYKDRVEVEAIKHKVVETKNAEMYTDERKVTREGKDGSKEITYKDKYINGRLDSTQEIGEKIVEESVSELATVGTMKRLKLIEFKGNTEPISQLEVPEYVELDENGLPVEYKEVFEGKATAYTGDPATASGRKPMPGNVAVDPKQFPYGTELYIVSLDGQYIYGYSVAADTGGFVQKGNTDLDLYFNNEDMCYTWGNRPVRVYVL